MSQAIAEFFEPVRGFMRKLRGPLPEPSAAYVYDRAIEKRRLAYGQLREAVAVLIYLRNRLEMDVSERRMEIARLHSEATALTRRGADNRALSLLEEKYRLSRELSQSEDELFHAKKSVLDAGESLARFNASIRELEREKRESLSSLGAAWARRRFEEVWSELDDEAMLALDKVRERVAGAREAAGLVRALHSLEAGDPLLEEDRVTAARLDLATIKSRLR